MSEKQERREPPEREQVQEFEEEAYAAKRSHGEEPQLAEEHERDG